MCSQTSRKIDVTIFLKNSVSSLSVSAVQLFEFRHSFQKKMMQIRTRDTERFISIDYKLVSVVVGC